MLALIVLILLYSYIGNWLEYREVHGCVYRSTSFTKLGLELLLVSRSD